MTVSSCNTVGFRMSSINTLKELETVFDKKQAEVLSLVFEKHDTSLLESLVTKKDLEISKLEIKEDVSNFRAEIKGEISNFNAEIKDEVNGLRKEMYKGFIENQKSITDVQKSITRMTIYFISAIGIIATIFKLLDIFVKP